MIQSIPEGAFKIQEIERSKYNDQTVGISRPKYE